VDNTTEFAGEFDLAFIDNFCLDASYKASVISTMSDFPSEIEVTSTVKES